MLYVLTKLKYKSSILFVGQDCNVLEAEKIVFESRHDSRLFKSYSFSELRISLLIGPTKL